MWVGAAVRDRAGGRVQRSLRHGKESEFVRREAGGAQGFERGGARMRVGSPASLWTEVSHAHTTSLSDGHRCRPCVTWAEGDRVCTLDLWDSEAPVNNHRAPAVCAAFLLMQGEGFEVEVLTAPGTKRVTCRELPCPRQNFQEGRWP